MGRGVGLAAPCDPFNMSTGSFVTFARDQLKELGAVEVRPMFGGFGLYLGDIFFGIVHGDRLYFKTDSRTATDYIDQGMSPFRPNLRQTLKNYYEVPPDVLDNAEQLVSWARAALTISRAGADRPSQP